MTNGIHFWEKKEKEGRKGGRETDEVLMYASTWKNIENIMLSERSQSQRTTYCRISFI